MGDWSLLIYLSVLEFRDQPQEIAVFMTLELDGIWSLELINAEGETHEIV